MNTAEEAQIALTVLLTGLVVVFAVLIFLTLIIKGYGSAVYSMRQKKTAPAADKSAPAPVPTVSVAPVPVVEEGISGEVLAAIAAAVYMTYENSSAPVVIKSVKRTSSVSPRSVWGAAGRLENTRPF